jgi:hypothetical protein
VLAEERAGRADPDDVAKARNNKRLSEECYATIEKIDQEAKENADRRAELERKMLEW